MAIVAIFLLSSYQNNRQADELVYGEQVIIWGTFDAGIMNRLFLNIAQEDKAFQAVQYREINPASFDDEFVNAIAEGRSPDMIILVSDDVVKHRAKLLPIPFETLSQRFLQDTYADGASVFYRNDGVYAIPLAVDPLVMYWNRDIFASNGLAQPPATWEAVVASAAPRTIIRDSNKNITQSGVAFGEYRNVFRAKDTLLLLALQSGSRLVQETERGYEVRLNENVESGTRPPLEATLEFFTNFSNVNSPLYSWNRALPTDTQAFISGDLAMYFGRGSEVQGISNKNPNLNFDVAMVPQSGSASAARTFGTFYGFAIPRASGNRNGAYTAALKISSAKFADEFAVAYDMAPVRRDLISNGAENSFRAVIVQSALTARTWLDPDPEASNDILMRMVEDVVSNRARVSNAVTDAINRLVLEY